MPDNAPCPDTTRPPPAPTHLPMGFLPRRTDTSAAPSRGDAPAGTPGPSRPWDWLRAVLVVAVCTGIAEPVSRHFDLADVSMVYLAGVAYVATRERLSVALATAVASSLLFNLLYVPPRWSLNPLNPSHLFTFLVLLAVGALISRLAAQAREQNRERAQAQVRAEAERLRSTLLAGISHDLRTPLTTIVGAATSLLEQGPRLGDAQREALIRGLRDEARRLHGVMSDLLDLARMEDGALQLNHEWCPADDLVAEGLQALEPRLASHRLVLDIPPEAIVWCDPRLVEQALFNLVDNALRYTPPGSEIRVTVRQVAGACEIRVADNGPGLPAGPGEDLFRKFQRGQPERAGSGFGLGLALCQAVARLHGGRIEARNEGGACFTLILPQPAEGPRAPEID